MKLRSLFLLLIPACLQAQQEVAWSVDDCIRYAVGRNPSIRNSRLDARMADADRVAALGSFLPSVSTSGSLGKRYGRSVDPTTNLYTSSSFVESNLGLNVSLTLFEGFTRINKARFARLNGQIGRLDARTKQNDVAYEVMDAFYKLCFEEKMWLLSVEQRRLGERYLVRMDEYVELGMRSPSDRQEVRARLEADRYQEAVRGNNVRVCLLYLKELLSLAPGDSLRIGYETDDTCIALSENLPADALYRASEEVLPQLQASKLRLEAANRAVAVAAGRFSPCVKAEFGLNTGYYDTERDEAGNLLAFSNQLRNNQNRYIGLSVSLPLLSGLSRLTGVRKERLRAQQAANNVEMLERSLRSEVEEATLSLQAAVAEHRQALEQWHADQQTLNESEAKWEEGLVSVFELMEKRNRYISAKAELLRTRLEYEIKSRMIRFYRSGTFLYTE